MGALQGLEGCKGMMALETGAFDSLPSPLLRWACRQEDLFGMDGGFQPPVRPSADVYRQHFLT